MKRFTWKTIGTRALSPALAFKSMLELESSRHIRHRGNRVALWQAVPWRQPIVETLEARRLLSVQVSYHGDDPAHGNGIILGIIPNAQVSTVYWGQPWLTNQVLQVDANSLTGFYKTIVTSEYMDMLSQYTGYTINARTGARQDFVVGRGTFTQADFASEVFPVSGPVTDTDIQQMLIDEISSRRVGAPSSNSLYVVYLPPGVSAADAPPGVLGYHYNFGVPTSPTTGVNVSYAVIPFPSNRVPQTLLDLTNTFEDQTITGSHELSEAVTDVRLHPQTGGGPVQPGLGWYDSNSGREIGDLCEPPNLKVGQLDGYWVQAEWSNIPDGGDYRTLPPGTKYIYADGNGLGIFSSGGSTVDDADPLAGHVPTASPPTYDFVERFSPADPAQMITATQGLLSNASDPNSLTLSAEILRGTLFGPISVNTDGSFIYSPSPGFTGADSFTVELTDGEFQSDPITVNIVVNAPAPLIVSAGLAFDATEGTRFTQELATFTDPNGAESASDYVASVQWGPGTFVQPATVSGPDPNGTFTVTASDSDSEEDPTAVPITVVVGRQGASRQTITDFATSVDAPLHATAVNVNAVAGLPFTADVATFYDENVAGPISDFSATIEWGDGQTSSGTVSIGGSGLQVAGSHAYASSGTESITVVIDDRGGSSATVNGSAAVSTGTPHQRYVTAVYQDVLGRAPDPDGLAFWANLLDNGTPITSVAQSIAHSGEYYGNFVIKPDYLALLGRAADIDGIQYWTTKMQAGLTDQQLEAQFAAADEFYNNAGGTDVKWIDAIYKLLLGRPAAKADEDFWSARLAAGLTRLQVAEQIAGSQENNTQLINDDYFHYLGRAADADGLTYWLGQFADGKTNEDVISGFTGSDEYYKKHTS